MVDLVAELAPRPGIDRVVDKATYSLFECEAGIRALEATGADTLLVSGGETDVCVLATLLGAVDRGYRVVLVTDAVASFSAAGHQAVLDAVLPRLPEQVELATTDTVLAAVEHS
jgi:nicotinamidase-related amidase